MPRSLDRIPRPRSLTARLVATTVLLVAVVSVLIGAAATWALGSYLGQRLDDDVRASLGRAAGDGPPGGAGSVLEDGDGFRGGPGGRGGGRGASRGDRGQGVGTLTARWGPGDAEGEVLVDTRGGPAEVRELDAEVLDRLATLPVDGEPRDVGLPGLGEYRVVAATTGDGVVVAGLPTGEVGAILGRLVTAELVLVLLGVAGASVAGLVLVRRQLRPLREVAGTAHRVAELPLAAGEGVVSARVPAGLTDDRTEVGQVGAALNALLDHVETSLAARHRSEQQVRQFVADASHELRTPIATIQGYAELAGRHPEDTAQVVRSLARVSGEAVRMGTLVEDLLLLARLDAGRPLVRERVDLTRLLLEAVADARVLAPDHAWRLELPDEPIEAAGDAERLHQVVTNLLTNARKYTPPGTTVSVRADPGGFSVHDDGPGFDPAVVGTAFERFTRGDTARSREGGVGLGLALVRAIVAAHGGAVALSSTPGDTTVRVDLRAR